MKKKIIILYIVLILYAVALHFYLGGIFQSLTTLFFLIALFLLVMLEQTLHKKRMNNWAAIRNEGKWRFIGIRFVLVRGGIIFLLIVSFIPKVTPGILTLSVILPLFLVLLFAGNETWKGCESQFGIDSLRALSQKISVMKN